MTIGLIIGNFLPLHNGSLTLCKVAENLSRKVIITIVCNPTDPISAELRKAWLKMEMPNSEIQQIFNNQVSSQKSQMQVILKNFSTEFKSDEFHLFSSDPSSAGLAKTLNIKYTILDADKLSQNICSQTILADPISNWFDTPVSVRLSLIKRVVLVGPESVGKSTIAKKLKSSIIEYPFLPEYGRQYEIFREPGKYQDQEFSDIVNVHGAHRAALLPFSGPIFIEDTDELVTAVWVEMLMNKSLKNIEKKIKLPFLYLLLDPSVPFIPENTRYFDNENRLEFFNKIKEKLKKYGASYIIIQGGWSDRELECQKIIKNLLEKKIDWSKVTK